MLLPPAAMKSRAALDNYARARIRSTPSGEHLVIARVLGVYDIYCDPDDQSVGRHLVTDGFWESWITLAAVRFLAPGQRVVNIGANVGYYTILAADIVGPTGRVWAYEPNERLAEMIRKSAKANGFEDRIMVLARAVGAGAGAAQLVVDDVHLGSSYISTADRLALPGLRTVQVPAVSLDQETAFNRDKFDVAIIDAEGSEETIWDGMEQTLARSQDITILMEFSPTMYRNARDFFDRMKQSGFVMHLIDTDGLVVVADRDEVCDSPWAMLVLSKMRLG